jgi:hypothetical protein
MTLGELRQFIASIEGIPDEALVRTRARFGRYLRSLTVQEDDAGFRDYVRSVGTDEGAADRDHDGEGASAERSA